MSAAVDNWGLRRSARSQEAPEVDIPSLLAAV